MCRSQITGHVQDCALNPHTAFLYKCSLKDKKINSKRNKELKQEDPSQSPEFFSVIKMHARLTETIHAQPSAMHCKILESYANFCPFLVEMIMLCGLHWPCPVCAPSHIMTGGF